MRAPIAAAALNTHSAPIICQYSTRPTRPSRLGVWARMASRKVKNGAAGMKPGGVAIGGGSPSNARYRLSTIRHGFGRELPRRAHFSPTWGYDDAAGRMAKVDVWRSILAVVGDRLQADQSDLVEHTPQILRRQRALLAAQDLGQAGKIQRREGQRTAAAVPVGHAFQEAAHRVARALQFPEGAGVRRLSAACGQQRMAIVPPAPRH